MRRLSLLAGRHGKSKRKKCGIMRRKLSNDVVVGKFAFPAIHERSHTGKQLMKTINYSGLGYPEAGIEVIVKLAKSL